MAPRAACRRSSRPSSSGSGSRPTAAGPAARIPSLRSPLAGALEPPYGPEDFGVEARRVATEGLEAGLGRDDISRDLERAAQPVLAGRGSFYWEVVAGAFIADGRSFAQMSAYAEAGIRRYAIEAVMDEQTTEICRYLDGKTFSVGDALDRFDRLDRLDEPEDVKREKPWVRERIDPETGRKELFVQRGEEQTRIAVVERSGVGSRDERGEFSRGLANHELMDLGVSFPPYHGLCRTTTVPDG